jgi:selenocysteine-specific translation elongation factor
VALPNDSKLAASIGKGGTESSLIFYNRRIDDDTIAVLAPADLEKKYYAVPESLLLADVIVLSTANVDALLGETLIAAGMIDKPVILTDENDVSRFTKDANVTKVSIVKREAVLDEIRKSGTAESRGDVRVDLDAAFNVKGVGTVLLGLVRNGTIKVHDNLTHSSGKMVSVRSIQSLDVDIESAVKSIRVGLAVKGIESDEVQKGDVLTGKAIPRVKSAKAIIRLGKIYSEGNIKGEMIGFTSGFSQCKAKISAMEGDSCTINFEKAIPVDVGDTFLLTQDNKPRIFGAGSILGVS